MNEIERTQTTIRLPAELKERLAEEADRLGVTLKDLIVFILCGCFQNTFQE